MTLKGSSEEMLAFCHFSYLYYPCTFTPSTQTLQRRKERVFDIKVYEGHSQGVKVSFLRLSPDSDIMFDI